MKNITTYHFKSLEEIKAHLLSEVPTLYHGSQTSTVVPYERLNAYCETQGIAPLSLGNLGQMPKICELDEDNYLNLAGMVTWKEGREYCQTKGRTIMTSPTEELAALLSGIATSCTGERCFGFGTYRDHLVKVKYLDDKGEVKSLFYDALLKDHWAFQSEEGRSLLENYQETYQYYKDFKNAPFPRLERETDLMTGTEGQLGVIVEAKIRTTPLKDVTYIFMALPKWEVDFSLHLRVFDKVQGLRDKIYSCELIDENSWNYLDSEVVPRTGKDIIFLEIADEYFEVIYEQVLSHFPELGENDIFQVGESKCKQLRMQIPRAIFEVNAKMGVTKKGTDVQVTGDQFKGLLEQYRSMAKTGVGYNLFGHFGDAHLHFNFMPKPEEIEKCQDELEGLYEWVKKKRGSPFAEHGIGLLKRPFIRPFYSDIQFKMFRYLKSQMDPKSLFFPQGFMLME